MSKFAGYSVRLGPDRQWPIFFDNAASEDVLVRVFYRVDRIPSKKEFLVRLLGGASSDDRRHVEQLLPEIPRMFEEWESRGSDDRRWIPSRRCWYFAVFVGKPVDDPLVQLELEYMIDTHRGVTA